MIPPTKHFGKSTSLNIDISKLYVVAIYDVAIIILANIFLGVGNGTLCGCTFPGKEGGLQVLAGLAPSSHTVVSLLRN